MVTLAAAITKSPGHLLAPTLMMHLEQGYEAFASVPEGHVGRKVLVRPLKSPAAATPSRRRHGMLTSSHYWSAFERVSQPFTGQNDKSRELTRTSRPAGHRHPHICRYRTHGAARHRQQATPYADGHPDCERYICVGISPRHTAERVERRDPDG